MTEASNVDASAERDGRLSASSVVIKICGITSDADALLCVGLGADALGFQFTDPPRQVSASLVDHIVKRLPSEILTVGIFRDEDRERVVESATSIGLGAVQLHGRETIEDCQWVKDRVPRTIKAFSAGDPQVGRFEEYGADYVLIDGASPGSGEVFDWRLAEGVVDPTRMFIAGGLQPANVSQAIRYLHPYGVDVATGVESAPGRKDPNLVRAFVVAARQAASLTQTVGPVLSPEDPEQPYDWMGDR